MIMHLVGELQYLLKKEIQSRQSSDRTREEGD